MPQVVVIKKDNCKILMVHIKKHRSKNAARTIAATRWRSLKEKVQNGKNSK